MNNLDQNNINEINNIYAADINEEVNIKLPDNINNNANKVREKMDAEEEKRVEEARKQEEERIARERREQEIEKENERLREEQRAATYEFDVDMLVALKQGKKLNPAQQGKYDITDWNAINKRMHEDQEYWDLVFDVAEQRYNNMMKAPDAGDANNAQNNMANANPQQDINANPEQNNNANPQQNNNANPQPGNEDLQRQKEREELELAIARLKKEKQEMEQALAKQKEEFEAAKANQAKELEEMKKDENRKEENKENNKENKKEEDKENEKKEEKKKEEPKWKNPNAKKGAFSETDNLLEITDKHANEAATLKIIADMTPLLKKSSPEFKRMQKAIERFDKFMKQIKGRTTLSAEEMEKYDKYSHDVYKSSDDYYKKKESEMELDDQGNKVPSSKYEESRMNAAAEIRETVRKMRHEMFDNQIKAKVDEMHARCEQQLVNLENAREKIAAEGIKDANQLQPRIENNISHTIFYANRMAHLEKSGDLVMKDGESFSSAINRLNASTIPQKGEIESIKENKIGISIIESGINAAVKGKGIKNDEIKNLQMQGVKSLVPIVRNQMRIRENQMQRRRSVVNNRKNPENQRRRAGSMVR